MELSSLLTEHFRLNDPQRKALKRLGLETVRDLLYWSPARYSDISQVKLIRDIEPGETVTIYGRIRNPKTKKSFRGRVPMGEATIEDVQGDSIKVIWFHQAFIAKTLKDSDTVKLTGKVSDSKYGLSITNPEFEQAPDLPIDAHDSLFKSDTSSNTQFGYPVYRESRGITSKWMYHAVQKIFGSGLLDQIEDPIPSEILEAYNLPPLKTSLIWIHTPQKKSDAEAARKRFAFEEIFFIQLAKQRDRAAYEEHFSFKLEANQSEVQTFIDRFPWPLTGAQSRAIDAIIGDMTSDKPMSRLLEGDVGSGKTAVAATASYAVIKNRPTGQDFGTLQVAYMAPTEILASQHFESFIEYFEHTDIQIALITGSGCKKFPSKVDPSGWTTISRNQLLKWVKNGEIAVVIGTHALIQKSVAFKDLGLVIIDEQHRFGTKQRMKLARKDRAPHLLSMTATPIPRTLALTIYGDLDLTLLDEMPAGRKPVITEIVEPDPDKRNQTYNAIKEQLVQGRQLYVICPRIDEPDPDKERALQLKSVKAEAKRLKKDVFPEYEIDILHSKMTKQKKEEVMEKFSNAKIDILVSTSVVEVGVNVPNATMIIIEGAERFGLAQLHQLRGRVIRGTHQAYCYLFADAKSTKTVDRLNALVTASNGFELAELDLTLRGTGDLAGRKQWGISDLAMEAIKNIKMVEAARTEARRLIAKDRDLKNYPKLHEVLDSKQFEIHFE